MSILVTGYMDLDPAKRDAFIAAAIACQTATREEDGNEGYAFTADLSDPGHFLVAEQWADQASVDAHMVSPHFLAFMGAMGDFGITGASITRWDGGTPSKMM